MKKGFSLIELMVSISIIAIIMSFAISAYTKGRDRQAGRAAGDLILSFLTLNQKKASIGDRDCTGIYEGQEVTVNADRTLSARSICSTSIGTTEITDPLPDITTINTSTLTFKPLSQGIELSSDPLNITYVTSAGSTFMVQVTSSGTIEYKGIQ